VTVTGAGVDDDASGSVAGVQIEHVDDVTVVRVLPGSPMPVAPEVLGMVAEAAAEGALVLDLSEVTLTEPSGVVTLVGAMAAAAEDATNCCVVARRASGRRLLRQWAVDRTVTLFASVGDALQARRHELDGYGPGWRADERG
jgi:anti-anti-sigma regulatory factor